MTAALAPRPPRQPADAAPPGEGRDALLRVALRAFVEQGFHGASMRDIALRAGTSVSATYHYFPSKADILRRIMTGVTGDLIAALKAARDAAGADPAARMAALVRTHVLLHTDRRDEAFVANSELRSLGPSDRAAVVAQRDAVVAIFRAVVAEGLASGRFGCPHPADTTIAILTMCTSVAGWFRSDGRETPATIAERYAGLALRMLDCRDRPR